MEIFAVNNFSLNKVKQQKYSKSFSKKNNNKNNNQNIINNKCHQSNTIIIKQCSPTLSCAETLEKKMFVVVASFFFLIYL